MVVVQILSSLNEESFLWTQTGHKGEGVAHVSVRHLLSTCAVLPGMLSLTRCTDFFIAVDHCNVRGHTFQLNSHYAA
jgi:hypothetical protein